MEAHYVFPFIEHSARIPQSKSPSCIFSGCIKQEQWRSNRIPILDQCGWGSKAETCSQHRLDFSGWYRDRQVEYWTPKQRRRIIVFWFRSTTRRKYASHENIKFLVERRPQPRLIGRNRDITMNAHVIHVCVKMLILPNMFFRFWSYIFSFNTSCYVPPSLKPLPPATASEFRLLNIDLDAVQNKIFCLCILNPIHKMKPEKDERN